MTLSLIHKQ